MGTERPANDSAREREHDGPSHAAPEGAGLHPLIDLSRDPNPGVPDHAKPEDD
ncbi:hypothetical protein [Saccharopolyspora rosea]|uniref:Uncharacterized protein n=1 Tax=Saccharopolyspora rosea TaxID=524884 RepID=A0ABW3FS41_9PSEU|nr:hypothetical protein [Saccharopolyspora rosea]